jgi:hypothetical protein
MVNRFPLLILLVFSICVLTACAEYDQSTSRYVPEVMMGTDCGFDKLKCCTSTPVCNYGQQCCLDPNDSNRNYCDENCGCGNNEEFCCAGDVCHGNAVCVSGICQACGGKDQICCTASSSCADELTCFNDKCAECGKNGEPCCAGASQCSSPAGERSECLQGVCSDCGFDGNPPCFNGGKCQAGQLLTGKTCNPCGHSNQPCCDIASGTGYDCDPAQGLKCELGFCQASQ